MSSVPSNNKINPTKYQSASRETQVQALDALAKGGVTQKELAESNGVPRTTLNYWHTRRNRMENELDPELVRFYESPVGLAHLHQLITAAGYVFNKVGDTGVPHIHKFLELSGLSSFTASSEGSLYKVLGKMDDDLIEFGCTETDRLAKEMKEKKVTLALDETFFRDRMVLVIMEPVSNYVLAEEVCDKRDAETWKSVAQVSLKGLNVTPIQVVGDEGSGLTSFALNVLGVHKSTDLFHVLQDISKSMCGRLARQIKAAEAQIKDSSEGAEQARQDAKLELEKQGVTFSSPTKRLTNKMSKIEKCDKAKEQAERKLQTLQQNKEVVQDAKTTISRACHPFDLETGHEQSPQKVEKQLNTAYDSLESVARSINCSDKQQGLLKKSRGMIGSLVASITFFFLTLKDLMEHSLTLDEQLIFEIFLVPIAYLRLVGDRSKDPETKRIIEVTIERLESELKIRDGPWQALSSERQADLQKLALECACIFQRSSSCVEGRNGNLSLKNQAQRSLSAKRIKVLTVIHNYGIERTDGTTPAERFFEKKPRSLFDWLLERTEWPIRPRKKRWTIPRPRQAA